MKSYCQKISKADVPLVFNQIYMDEITLESPELDYGKYSSLIKSMVDLSPIKVGTAFLTIDSKNVLRGDTHRRGGPHVDGNYLFGWGGMSGWLTGSRGRKLPLDKHLKQYANPLGGTLIASSYSSACAWIGNYGFIPKQGGDCSGFDFSGMHRIPLNANSIYLLNSTCIHESLPLDKNVHRTIVRLTLPPKSIFDESK